MVIVESRQPLLFSNYKGPYIIDLDPYYGSIKEPFKEP